MPDLSSINRIRLAALLFMLTIAFGCTAVRADAATADPHDLAPRTSQTFIMPSSLVIVNDIPYGQGDGVPLYMNTIAPKARPKLPMPCVLWIHGGGWHAGNRYSGQFETAYLAQRGYFCASIDYRLSDSYVWPAQIQDCKCAVRYLRAHAREYGIDPTRIGVWGDSAGAHLATLLGTTANVASFEGQGGNPSASSVVQAVCDWYGPTDIAQMQAEGSELNPADPLSAPALLFGTGGLAKHAGAVQSANPNVFASRSSAPTLIVHGDADRSVPLEQSRLLYNSLSKVGVPVQLIVLKGAGHGDEQFHSDRVMSACVAFFDKYLAHDLPSSPRIAEAGTLGTANKKAPRAR